jgi:squalene cyclase
MRQQAPHLSTLLCALFFWAQSYAVHASPATDVGVQWLSVNQQTEGFWVGGSGGTPLRDTTAAANALKILNPSSAAYGQAVQWLSGVASGVTDYAARRIYTLSGTALDVSSEVAALVATQHADGGFGLDIDHESNPLDTALVLEAFVSTNYTTGPFIATTVGYLLNTQQGNGSWIDGSAESSVQVTSHALRALFPEG